MHNRTMQLEDRQRRSHDVAEMPSQWCNFIFELGDGFHKRHVM